MARLMENGGFRGWCLLMAGFRERHIDVWAFAWAAGEPEARLAKVPLKKPDGTTASDAENPHKTGERGLCAGGSRGPESGSVWLQGWGLLGIRPKNTKTGISGVLHLGIFIF